MASMVDKYSNKSMDKGSTVFFLSIFNYQKKVPFVVANTRSHNFGDESKAVWPTGAVILVTQLYSKLNRAQLAAELGHLQAQIRQLKLIAWRGKEQQCPG
jgi:hypothetical protein